MTLKLDAAAVANESAEGALAVSNFVPREAVITLEKSAEAFDCLPSSEEESPWCLAEAAAVVACSGAYGAILTAQAILIQAGNYAGALDLQPAADQANGALDCARTAYAQCRGANC